MMKKKWLSKIIAIIPICALITSIVIPDGIANANPWRSSLYPANWTPGYQDAQGRFLQDFSYAGYWRGEKNIPTNPPGATYNAVTQYGADPSGVADSTNAIQNAINAAGTAGGGIVYLPSGTYKVRPQGSSNSAIWINRNNVVLRGAGKSSTFIFNDSTSMRDKAVVRVAPINSADWFSPTNTPTSIRSDIQTQSTRIPVSSVSGYNVNEFIIVRADASDAFIAEHRMSGLWNSSLRGQTFNRQIVGIEASTNTLIVDIPIRYTLKTRDNARVYKIGQAITEAGIENLSIGMRQHTGSGWGDTDFNRSGTGAYDVHASKAVTFSHARNSWMDNVNSYRPSFNGSDIHLLSHGVVINQSRSITIQNSHLQKPQYRGEGGNGYLYHVQGGDIQNSAATNARHSFTMSSMWTNGNVFFNNTSNYPRLASDFHMHLSVANLFDSMKMNGDYLEAVYRPYGTVQHGWTTSQSVFWNTTGNAYQSGQSAIVKSRQWGQGYV
ncbi:glycosyl hydrolase family 28-related protein, partial [Peribacillus sp. NPDC056705]|uniref:glycosyl hydrolase family 28-related protein n=1 Tax=Peribacillus sp. NPDC056705 TaxID=3345918 RepID=UPI0037482463